MSPVWTEVSNLPCRCFVYVCVCVTTHVNVSTDIFASIFKSESGVLEVSFCVCPVVSECDEGDLPELCLQQYGGPEVRMRKQVLSVP